jgi:tubulin-specific chaperone D
MFKRAMPLLVFAEYRPFLLSGLVISVGGLTESTVRHSADALVTFVTEHADDEVAASTNAAAAAPVTTASAPSCTVPSSPSSPTTVHLDAAMAEDMMWVLRTNKGDPRVVIPAFKTVELMLAQFCFAALTADVSDFPLDLLKRVKGEISRSPNANKVLASINVLLGLIPAGPPVHKQALQLLLLLLVHQFPKVRRVCAESMYSRLLPEEEALGITDQMDDILVALSETAWDGPAVNARAQSDRLFGLLRVPFPTKEERESFELQEKNASKWANMTGTYADLVNEFHG